MKTLHSTNYYNTFIQVSEDTKVRCGTIPPERDTPSIARLQWELLHNNPYKFSSDEVLFYIYVLRNQIPVEHLQAARELFFSKGQACFRTSPLAKNYGYGIHFDELGKMALYGMETDEYKALASDKNIRQLKAMRSGRK